MPSFNSRRRAFCFKRHAFLLIVSLDQLSRSSFEIAKQSAWTCIGNGEGSEVELCGGCFGRIAVGRADIARADRPNARDGERFSSCIPQQSIEFSGGQVIGCDEAGGLRSAAAGELPDQQIVTEASEIERRQCNAPRSIQPASVLETPQEPS